MVGLGLSFKYSGLNLDRKMWQSAHLWCVRFGFISCHLLRKRLHTLLKRQRQILHCYHTCGVKFAPSRLCLVTETA